MSRLPELRRTLVRAALASIPVVALPFMLGGGCQRNSLKRSTVPELRAEFSERADCEDGSCDAALSSCLRGGDCDDACRISVRNLGCGGQGGISICELETTKAGDKVLVVKVMSACPAGRRPVGYAGAEAGGDSVGAWLARQAALEAASVPAFRMLARELAAHRAPARLIAAAEAAAIDEVRHARVVAELARHRGAEVAWPSVTGGGVRPLLDVAIDNEIEGCVRETAGAAVCWRQAMTAGDAGVRAAMAEIAGDETRHAELAAEISTWARGVLGPRGAALLDRARVDAEAELAAELSAPAGLQLQYELGLPAPTDAAAMVAALASATR
jgi:hypothetical protein